MNFDKIAAEVFVILHSYDFEVSLYDEDCAQVFEPEEARRFQSTKKDLLVAIIDDGENSKIKLYFRKDLPAESLMGLMDTLRMTATKYNMTFSSSKKDHDITPKDYATKIAVSETRTCQLTEGMYGTSRSSYLRLENARMIVRHSARINEDMMGARGRNIDSIYIEDQQGQRMLFPTKQLAPARAMTHHVNNGGTWTDEGGQDICRLANDYSDLRELSRHIHRHTSSLTEDAHKIRIHCREGIRRLRKTFESVCRKTRYEDVMKSLKKPLNEEQSNLSETVNKIKSCCHVDESELDPRVYETAAKCIREADELEASSKMPSIAGISVSRESWAAFKNGELPLDAHLHEPAGIEDRRAYNSAAMRAIGAATKDPQMAAIFYKIADECESGEMAHSAKAFVAHALKIVGWEKPTQIAAMEPVKKYAEWMDSHTADKAVDEHRGTFKKTITEDYYPSDVIDKSYNVADVEVTRTLDARKIEPVNDITNHAKYISLVNAFRSLGWQGRPILVMDSANGWTALTGSHRIFAARAAKIDVPVHQVKDDVLWYTNEEGDTIDDLYGRRDDNKLAAFLDEAGDHESAILARYESLFWESKVPKGAPEALAEDDAFITQGVEPDEDDLTLDDIILPTDQGESLKDEVTVSTVINPDTGKEEMPSTSYISRLRSLAGLGKTQDRTIY